MFFFLNGRETWKPALVSHTAYILIVEKTTFHCLLFPMYFQCIFSTQEMLVVNGCYKVHETTALNTSFTCKQKCNETTALNTSFTCKFGYFLLPYNRKMYIV